jgi:hypothetical protein
VELYKVEAAEQGALLWLTLEETLQDLLIFHESIAWRTLLPNPALEALLPGLAARLHLREESFVLASTTKRRMLLKLLALRSFIQAGAAAHGQQQVSHASRFLKKA